MAVARGTAAPSGAGLKDAQKKQLEIYGNAWKGRDGRAESGGEMRKSLEVREWDYFDHDGAKFRRRRRTNGWRAVDDVLHGKE
ncbi:MAG: hypothetical protein JO320_15765 [Alphaproteobacteria bacterium]|nr:hypothetical protein [Alphaproteobacteria bacterium]